MAWQTWALRWMVLAGLILLALIVYSLVTGDSLALPAMLAIAAGAALIGTLALAGLGALGRSGRGIGADGEAIVLAEAQRLRAMRERARAIHEMTTTLSASLSYRRVLEDAQNIGTLSLRDDLGPETRLVSAVLLFQRDHLRVITSRGLTATDQNVALEGKRGVLGLALQQTRPVFGGPAIDDPELRYLVAFQSAKSVLAIPLGIGLEIYGAMVFGCEKPNAFSDDHVELMTAIGRQSTLALQNAVLYQNLANEKEKIIAVEEDARKKLARDLHDGPTQSVAAIAMRANYIRRLIERQPQQAIEELRKVEDLARRTTKEIRHMLFTLRPLVLENQGLIAALQQLAEKMKDTHATTVLVEAQPEIDTLLDTNAQGVLFYIIEEAVNNARKHAQSDQIIVRLFRQEAYLIAEVEDHGVGFDVEAVESGYDRRGSLGMINMRERAELIEGQLHIASAKGKGTTISVRVPIQRSSITSADLTSAPPLQLQTQRQARQAAATLQAPAEAEEPAPVAPPAHSASDALTPRARPALRPAAAAMPASPAVSRPLRRRTITSIRSQAGAPALPLAVEATPSATEPAASAAALAGAPAEPQPPTDASGVPQSAPPETPPTDSAPAPQTPSGAASAPDQSAPASNTPAPRRVTRSLKPPQGE